MIVNGYNRDEASLTSGGQAISGLVCPAETGCVRLDAASSQKANRLATGNTGRIPRAAGAGLPRLSVTIDDITTRDNFAEAIRKVSSKPEKSPGLDHKTVTRTCHEVRRNQSRIRKRIRDGRYNFQNCKEVRIEKAEGGRRTLNLPTVADRIVHTAVRQKVEPLLDSHYMGSSHAYRHHHSPYTAADDAKRAILEGNTYAADLDIKGCFDNIDHGILDYLVDSVIADGVLADLIKRSYRAGTGQKGPERDKGLPQGAPLCPTLCNLYLHRIDRTLENRGIRHVRYADNIVVMARSGRAATRHRHTLEKMLREQRGLELNPDKTRICRTDELSYLGFSFVNGRTGIAPKALGHLRSRIANWNPDRKDAIRDMADFLGGWLAYFSRVDRQGEVDTAVKWIGASMAGHPGVLGRLALISPRMGGLLAMKPVLRTAAVRPSASIARIPMNAFS